MVVNCAQAWPTPGLRARVLLINGMSGVWRSTALKTLEDVGYKAFDKLPLSLAPAILPQSPWAPMREPEAFLVRA
jgi:RNase adaptor protein for sRNA GlmZ degradation